MFHAVSAFNNAGFALYPDNLIGFATDPWICLPIAVAVIVGGLGFPVLFELRRGWRTPARVVRAHQDHRLRPPRCCSSSAPSRSLRLEWGNPGTLGPLGVGGQAAGRRSSRAVMPRTAGFNSVDFAPDAPDRACWSPTC